MAVSTNPLGLLLAEIDSTGSLRLAGDRVLFGKGGRARADSEWLIRQKVTQCRQIIADVVHRYGGIVARTDGDRLLCHLPDACSALESGCAIQLAIAPRAGGETALGSATIAAQMGVRIAVHHGPLQVEGGILSGPHLDRVQALLNVAEPDQVLASQVLVDSLPAALRALTRESDIVARDSDDHPLPTWQVDWERAQPRVRVAHLSGAQEAVPAAPLPAPASAPPSGLDEADPDVTQTLRAREVPAGPAPGLMQRLTAAGAAASAGPVLRLRRGEREVVLGRSRPSIALRQSPHGAEHARIVLREGTFVLENRSSDGTYVRFAGAAPQHCVDRVALSGAGVISLAGADFSDAGRLLEFRIA